MAEIVQQREERSAPAFGETRSQLITYGIIAMVLATMLMAPGVEFFLTPDGRFLPTGDLFHWDRWIVALHLVSDLVIGLSYVVISVTLWYLAHRAKQSLPFLWTFIAFGIFIIACGFTHFMGALTLWIPLFWASAAIKAVTAIASVATALAVPPLVPKVLYLVDSLKASNQQREQLREQAELLDLAHEAIFVRSLVGSRITFWNRGATEMYGWEAEEALGKVPRDLLQSRYPIPLAEIEQEVLRTGRWEGELAQMARNGEELIVDSRWALQCSADGRPIGILELNTDVTKRRKAEEALRRLNLELEDRVVQRTKALEVANATLEQVALERAVLLESEQAARTRAEEALRLRNEFISIASHELKTPLTALQLQIQMLERALRQGVAGQLQPERLQSLLSKGERQIKRLSRLNEDLLDVSRIASGRFEVDKRYGDLAVVVERAVESMNDSRVKIQALDKSVGLWDEFRMEQVVINLLSNALKFGEDKPVEVELWDFGNEVRLTVRDHGMGIAPEDQERIFAQFERAVPARNYGGLGLGLYISRWIVEQHGGTIAVESTPGQGALFTVRLPIAE